MEEVAISRCNTYAEDKVYRSTKEAVDRLGGITRYIHKGQTVLIKPNLLVASKPEEAICTHPAVVKAVVKLVQEAGGAVMIGDSPGFGSTERVASKAGIAHVCQETGATLVSFKEYREVTFRQGKVCKKFPLALPVLRADVIISVAKLKTHGLTGYTGAVKNLFGCIPGTLKPSFHLRMQKREDFGAMLVDLYCLVRPALSIVDGIIGMEGNGPRNGSPREVGVILAGADGVAVDTVAAAVIGMDPLSVPTNQAAARWGVGVTDIEEIEILGVKLADVMLKDFAFSSGVAQTADRVPAFLVNLLQNHLTAKPVVIPELCRGCGVCMESCPARTIRVAKGTAHIQEKECIRCYCCQELCPHNAIELRKSWLSRLL